MDTYSLTEYAQQFERLAFVCTCKKCKGNFTAYIPSNEWLSVAFVLMDTDKLTTKEFKKMNHLAVTQWGNR